MLGAPSTSTGLRSIVGGKHQGFLNVGRDLGSKDDRIVTRKAEMETCEHPSVCQLGHGVGKGAEAAVNARQAARDDREIGVLAEEGDSTVAAALLTPEWADGYSWK